VDAGSRFLDQPATVLLTVAQQRLGAPHVTAIDLDAPSIAQAQEHADDVDHVLGVFLAHPFEPASFDIVVSAATLHHMEAATGPA
jgi:ubiquinone/menaquinone biosynthesis C-methylase UbiE